MHRSLKSLHGGLFKNKIFISASLILSGLAALTFSLHRPPIPPAPTHLHSKAGFEKKQAHDPHSLNALSELPLYFTENRGVLPDASVRYFLQGRDKSILFKKDGITFLLNSSTAPQSSPFEFLPSLEASALVENSGQALREWVELAFVGTRSDVRLEGGQRSATRVNYLRGKPQEWKRGLPTYSEVVYSNLWPGIDLVYTGTTQRMKYLFRVKPGADPRQIQLAYRGIESLRRSDSGGLWIKTPANLLQDDRPIAYEETPRGPREVLADYRLDEKGEGGSWGYGFALGSYDPRNTLIIDPAYIIYSGFIGGSSYDAPAGIAVDSAGNVYVGGTTDSTQATFPDGDGVGSLPGYDGTYDGGWLGTNIYDAFVAKVKADGTGLDYVTYLGGAETDVGISLDIDSSGNAYLGGHTNSPDFPTASTGIDLTPNGSTDAFVVKLNPSGTALVYSTFIGGPDGEERALGIDVDDSGNAYVCGRIRSDASTFPNGSGLASLSGVNVPYGTYSGNQDGFVAKINAAGTAFDYIGYIGGSGMDDAVSIQADASGNAYVVGLSYSTHSTFPLSPSFDGGGNAGDSDIFVLKVNAAGTAYDFLSFFGGASSDSPSSIALDSSGNIYVAGTTLSDENSFPTGSGFGSLPGYDHSYAGFSTFSWGDGFLLELNPSASNLLYATYIGGSAGDSVTDLLIDGSDNIYLVGTTNSDEQSFPVYGAGPDGATANGSNDAFAAKLKINSDGSTDFYYSRFFGGINSDGAGAITMDSSGYVYIAGSTTSSNFPVEIGPDLVGNGAEDVFVMKISTYPDLSISQTHTPSPVYLGNSITMTLTASNDTTDDATGVTVVDTLPDSSKASYVSSNPSQGTCGFSAGVVTCSLGSLARGASATIEISLTAIDTGSITNIASISGNESDLNSGNDGSTANFTLNPPLPNLALSSSFTSPFSSGQNASYTVTVSNIGPSAADSVSLTNLLPASLGYISAIPSQGSCSQASSLYGISEWVNDYWYDDRLFTLDPNYGYVNYSGIPPVTATLSGQTVLGGKGLAVDPTTGRLWGLLDLGSGSEALVTFDESTGSTLYSGASTLIALTSDLESLAFDLQGNLYSITGVGSSTPHHLVSLNKATAAQTDVMAVSSSAAYTGIPHVLALRPTDGLFYHVYYSESTDADGNLVTGYAYESIDVGTQSLTQIPITSSDGMTMWDPRSMGYVAARDDFMTMANLSFYYWAGGIQTFSINPAGSTTYLSGGDPTGGVAESYRMNCDLGSIASGDSVSIEFTYSPIGTGSMRNLSWVSSSQSDSDDSDNSLTDSITVNSGTGGGSPSIDLEVSVNDTPDPAMPGENLTYTVTLANQGASAATGVTVVASLPAGVSYVSASSQAGSCSEAAGIVTCSLSSLASSGSDTITIVVSPGSAGSLSLTVSATANETDADASNNQDSEATAVVEPNTVDLSVSHVVSSESVLLGEELSYSVTVSNEGSATAHHVSLTDTFSPTAELLTALVGAQDCSPSGNSVSCDLGNLGPGQSLSATLVLLPTVSGQIESTASVSADESEADSSNNSSSLAVNIVGSGSGGEDGQEGGDTGDHVGSQGSLDELSGGGLGTCALSSDPNPTARGAWALLSSFLCLPLALRIFIRQRPI